MKIEIKNRFTGKIILCGKYENVKDCLVKNKGADLWGADLWGADLRGADLWGTNLRGADLWGADLEGAVLRGINLRGADLWEANLEGANLEGADLEGADLEEADLRGADLREAVLRGTNLRGAVLRRVKNYSEKHEVFQEVVRAQKAETFTEKEWVCIVQICIHRLCWDSIKKRFGETAMKVFKKLSKVGFDEWEKKYKKVLRAK